MTSTSASTQQLSFDTTHEIPPRTGIAFHLLKSQTLTVISPQGSQVSDLLAFNLHDTNEVISSGRTLDYASHLFLTIPDPLYSNRSHIMLKIIEDTCGRHDFLLTPCSKDTFRIIYGEEEERCHRGCWGNFEDVLKEYGVEGDRIPVAFNCFMNTVVDGETGELRVECPRSKKGDFVRFGAEMDLLVALTACSAGQSNGGSFKPLWFRIEG